MQVDFIKPEQAEDLERFVERHEHGSIEQTWAWGELQTTIPGRDAFFVLGVFAPAQKKSGSEPGKIPGKIVGSMLLIMQEMGCGKLGRGKCWLWCPGGPLLPRDKKAAAGAWRLLRQACRKLARKEGAVFMRIEPNYPAGDVGGAGDAGGFKFGGRVSKESYLPRNTLFVKLGDEKTGILSQMKQKGRYNIKQAEKAGVHSMISDGQDLAEFYDILKETAERDGFHLHDRKFYELFLDTLGDRARFYVARLDHEVVAGILLTFFGNTATYYFGASSDKHRNAMAPYALQWFAMQDAKEAGCERYDFLGIAPTDGGGEFDKNHVLAGVTQFKTRFGGEQVEYENARVFVYRRGWWLAYKAAKWAKGLTKG